MKKFVLFYRYFKIAMMGGMLFFFAGAKADDGYRLWLRYDKIDDTKILSAYNSLIPAMYCFGHSPASALMKEELTTGLSGLLGKTIQSDKSLISKGGIIAGVYEDMESPYKSWVPEIIRDLPADGFLIFTKKYKEKTFTIVTSRSETGVLYGAFRFLRILQTHQAINNLNIKDFPKTKVRILDHWDNLDRTVERGYAGFSLWNWHKLPGYLDPRYKDYARVNASIGINGTVLNNVNANALILTPEYLEKVQALAGVFRPYGIRVYLTARFSAPMEIGKLKTANPLDPEVKSWWKEKVNEIYKYIPDFGGFLVKANSEGQPGPQNYNCTHADGANMLAEALAPHGGIVMWRAFVYDANVPDDRAKQAYNEFKPLDGKFLSNVMVQVKNGPIDFQPREPFHPLFGAMPQTPLMMEFQLTQEYLGFSTHLVYLGSLFEECLQSDTYAKGTGSTVARVIEGTLENHTLTGIAGVANIGNDINWCGHPFAQANWYALGRFAWNPEEKAESIADDWLRMTFSNNPQFLEPVKKMMMNSRETAVNYMTPLGLHHIMGWSHHYGPGPWVDHKQRADWTAVYYHKADTMGIGFDRTTSGSNALSQYNPQAADVWKDIQKCPEAYLLWFHHVNWNYTLKSGKSLWNVLCLHYYAGVDSLSRMEDVWNSMQPLVDKERFEQVKMLLAMQKKEARIWRNSCILYFQSFSKLPIPQGLELPDKPLDYYMNLKYSFVPGN